MAIAYGTIFAMQRLRFIGFALLLASCIPMEQTLPPMPESPQDARSSFSTATRTESEGKYVAINGTGATLLREFLQTNPPDIGSIDAPVAMLVITHPSCGYCRQLQNELIPAVAETFVAEGLVRVHTIILPIDKYPESALHAGLLHCADVQGKHHEMLSALMTRDIRDHAGAMKMKDLSIDMKIIEACLDVPSTANAWKRESALADALGVTLVPTIVLDGRIHVGLPSKADLEGMVLEAIE